MYGETRMSRPVGRDWPALQIYLVCHFLIYIFFDKNTPSENTKELHKLLLEFELHKSFLELELIKVWIPRIFSEIWNSNMMTRLDCENLKSVNHSWSMNWCLIKIKLRDSWMFHAVWNFKKKLNYLKRFHTHKGFKFQHIARAICLYIDFS